MESSRPLERVCERDGSWLVIPWFAMCFAFPFAASPRHARSTTKVNMDAKTVTQQSWHSIIWLDSHHHRANKVAAEALCEQLAKATNPNVPATHHPTLTLPPC